MAGSLQEARKHIPPSAEIRVDLLNTWMIGGGGGRREGIGLQMVPGKCRRLSFINAEEKYDYKSPNTLSSYTLSVIYLDEMLKGF